MIALNGTQTQNLMTTDPMLYQLTYTSTWEIYQNYLGSSRNIEPVNIEREDNTKRIFMPCNLSSCRVLENLRVPFTLEFQQGKNKMFRFILEFKPLNIFFKGSIWYKP